MKSKRIKYSKEEMRFKLSAIGVEMPAKASVEECEQYIILHNLQENNQIKDLIWQPEFCLYGKSGLPIKKFTPDFQFVVISSNFGIPVDSKVIMEYKGSKKGRSYGGGYTTFRKWFILDYPEYVYLENIAGTVIPVKFNQTKCE